MGLCSSEHPEGSENKTSDLLNKNHYQMGLLKSFAEQATITSVATTGFLGNYKWLQLRTRSVDSE